MCSMVVELRQEAPALLVRAIGVDHPARHVVDRDEGRDGGAARRQRLEDQRRVEPRQARAADVLAHIDAAHAERGGLAHLVDREVLRLVPVQGMRRDLGREVARHVADRDWSSFRAKSDMGWTDPQECKTKRARP